MNTHYYQKHSAKVRKFLAGELDILFLYTNSPIVKKLEKEYPVRLQSRNAPKRKTGLALYEVTKS